MRAILIFLCLIFCSNLFAQNQTASLSLGAGVLNIGRKGSMPALQLEYKFRWECFHLKPLIGVISSTQGSVYAYGGISTDMFLWKEHVAFTPSFAVGYYNKGKGKKLGCPLEFRSSFELTYVFPNRMRIGIQFYHISNAGIGSRNPGTEALLLLFSTPLEGCNWF